jgi:hypothetical protein
MGCEQSKERPQDRNQKPAQSPERQDTDAAPLPKDAEQTEADPKVAPVPVKPKAKAARRGPTKHVDPAAGREDAADVADTVPPPERDSRFKLSGPAVPAENPTACFKTGLLYKIVDGDTTYFYNDTADFEMHVSFKYGPLSELEVLPPTKQIAAAGEKEWPQLELVVYPGETQPFIKGSFNGFQSRFSAKPLSEEYQKRLNDEAEASINDKIAVVKKFQAAAKDQDDVIAQCVASGATFVDLDFPPTQTSLSRPHDARALPSRVWKRPVEYLGGMEPRLFEDGVEPNDIDQGQLGDCWFLCSIASVAEFKGKIEDLFRHPVSLAKAVEERKVGAYRVTLNKNGWWRIVVVDDHLPVVGNNPCYAKNESQPSEIWVALLEKAYAKVNGSYSAITGGDALHALSDLTGYPTSRFDTEWEDALKASDGGATFFADLVQYDQEKYLVNLNTPGVDTSAYNGGGRANDEEFAKKYTAAGLAPGHAYSVLEAHHFPAASGREDVRLLKVRNPWGNGAEWSGDWGDTSDLWTKHPDIAKVCNFTAEDDGTFWMEWHDVKKYFDGGGVCFTKFDWFDYRVAAKFANGRPSIVLEVWADADIEAFAIVCQPDRRGQDKSSPNAKYSGLMCTIAAPDEDAGKHMGKGLLAVAHSTSDADRPSDKLTFNVARDVAIKYTFKASTRPYLVIPRIYDQNVEKDFVLGFIASHSSGEGKLRVNFKKLDGECPVFKNFKSFAYDPESVHSVDADFQFNPEVGAPATSRGPAFVRV